MRTKIEEVHINYLILFFNVYELYWYVYRNTKRPLSGTSAKKYKFLSTWSCKFLVRMENI